MGEGVKAIETVPVGTLRRTSHRHTRTFGLRLRGLDLWDVNIRPFSGLELKYSGINISAWRCFVTFRDLCAAVQKELDAVPLCTVRWKVFERPHASGTFAMCGSCFRLPQEIAKNYTFGPDENVKAAEVRWYQKQPRECFMEEHIWLCVHGMPASTTTGTIFNRLYSLA